MNDRYLYRAKTRLIVGTYNFGKEDGEWVKGYLYCDTGRWMIKQFEFDRANYIDYEVDQSTICQCTGLKDKNGKLIWENDKCMVRRPCVLAYGTIKYLDGCFCFVEDKTGNILRLCDVKTNGFEIKVESNIFDNPELLEPELLEVEHE